MAARKTTAPAGPQIHPAVLAIPVILVVAFVALRLFRGAGPEAVVKSYLKLMQDAKTKNDAQLLVLMGGGGPQATPGKSGAPVERYIPHMELEHLDTANLPGASVEIQPAIVNGNDATVAVVVKVGTLTANIPVYMQMGDDGWKIDLLRTNAEVRKWEEKLNSASGRASSSSAGGLGGSSNRSAAPGPR